MRTLDSELTRTADQLNEVVHRIPDRSWRDGKKRTWGVLRPALAGLAVVALVAIPAYLMSQESGGVAEGPDTTTPVVLPGEGEPGLIPPISSDEQSFSSRTTGRLWESGLVVVAERAGLAVELKHDDLIFASIRQNRSTGGHLGLFALGSGIEGVFGWDSNPIDWPPVDRDGRTLVYQDGSITIRGGKLASVLRHVDTHEIIGLSWAEDPYLDLVIVSTTGDLASLAEGMVRMTIDDYEKEMEKLDRPPGP
jgi:hypothetical protein